MKFSDEFNSKQKKSAMPRRICRRMIVDHVKGKHYEDHFTTIYHKLAQHIQYSPVTIPLSVLKDALKALQQSSSGVNGFRIYPAAEAGSLVYIFAGMIDEVDVEHYRILRQDETVSSIAKEKANKLVTKFQEEVVDKYLNTIVANNTRSYMYGKRLIQDFIDELDFHNSSSPINRVRIKLGAYFDASDNPPGAGVDYINRLLIGFSFIDRDGNEVGLDELTDPVFGCDLPHVKAIGADTGTPCPPGPGCNTPSLGK